MTKRASFLSGGDAISLSEWNPKFKEPWHIDFDKEPVNDEKWSCIVTAAIQAEAQDEKWIQIYTQWVKTGLRKAVKIISMNDVVKLLKETGKQEKPEKQGRNLKPSDSQIPQIVELATKFAIFSEAECTLPSDLMAAVIKHMILNLKYENCLAKRIAAVKERKIRERDIKAKFIRSLKPYETAQEEKKFSVNDYANISELQKPIDDEPPVGPDLYILLVDFYDVFIFPELLKINVPFLAILKISDSETSDLKQKTSFLSTKSDGFDKKKFAIKSIWETLKEEEHFNSEKNMKFKNIIVLEYKPHDDKMEPKFTKYIFDELTWVQYCAYCIYRQHQNYLKELYVQRLILSLETLDLSKCEVYNKLCDALITGESLTPLLVLYAIVEQVVAGVPETESIVLEYEPKFTDFFPTKSESITTTDSSNLTSNPATSCKCRYKQYVDFCENLKKNFFSGKNERTESSENSSISSQSQNGNNLSEKPSQTVCPESSISESLIDKVMRGRKTEKEMRKERRWKTPSLCFYGDFVFLQTYFCDRQILDRKSIIERFLKKLKLSQIWKNYPELPPEKRAFYNFHFFTLLENSEESEEKLKLKILFTSLSLKLISIQKSNMYLGSEEKNSEILSLLLQEKIKIKSNKDKNDTESDKEEEHNFQNFFLKTFIKKSNLLLPRKKNLNLENEKQLKISYLKRTTPYSLENSRLLQKVKSEFRMFSPIESSRLTFSQNVNFFEISKSNSVIFLDKNINEQSQDLQRTLFSLLDCSEISDLTSHHFFRKKADLKVIEDYKFYEKLNPSLMIQRLTEAQKNYNTVQCSYFPLLDSIIIIMHNDCDDRGIFFFGERGALPTPVGFRDFYNYVYPTIKNWLILENNEFLRSVSEIKEKEDAEKEKKDLKYLAQLKREYCEMSEEKKKEFLETDIDVQIEPEISEKELGDLRVKPKPQNLEKISFVATNFNDLWVETNQKNYEFHSSDGTEIHSAIETWLYTPLRLHKLEIKKSKLALYYNHWLDDEKVNFSFTLKTTSNIIFSFHKDDSEKMDDFNHHVTISWPTGLLIKPVFNGSNTYIKQGYLKTYRKGRDIEEELSRCFLKNGQVLIFKENGNYDILCGSGTKYSFKDLKTVPKCEIISTTGELWEVRSNNQCGNKKELIGNSKVFVGVDPKTQETFCRREDGVFLMLWQDGTLVTNYPDGTKITSTPYFEESEVITEWTEEEKLYYEDIEMKYRSEISVQEPRSRTILRNISVPRSIDKKNFVNEGFISVLCEYVMEHKKYSAVYFNKDPYIKMKMPEQLSVLIHPNGNYEVQQEKHFLKVNGSTIQFYTECDECKDQSMVTINVDSNEILCRCVDFCKSMFLVFWNGHIMFKKFYKESSDDSEQYDIKKSQENIGKNLNNCAAGHNKKTALTRRCFILNRDLNGMEFVHEDTFKDYCYHLPEETYFDINTDDPLNISYTFSSPNYTIGYEKWVMDYENDENSLPTSIKKKDLKELGTKDSPKKLFKYPFPRQRTDLHQNEKPKHIMNSPKLIVGRTIRCLCDEPSSVIDSMQYYVTQYQKKVEELHKKYKSQIVANDNLQESDDVEMKLRKIALTLNQNLQMYPHLGTQFPSTEREIHYFGHFIKSMDGMKNRLQYGTSILPDCKQIPKPLPGSSDLPHIYEETESPQNT